MRQARVRRETRETRISVELNLDGSGQYQIKTGLAMLDHLLEQLARHGRFDLKIEARGDFSSHHLIEDVGIALGRAFNEALGERKGIVRMGQALVPMDEALAQVAVDLSGRGYVVVEAEFSTTPIGEVPSDLVKHFLETFAAEGRMNLHASILRGTNDHHRAEALFKALARALDQATREDPRIAGQPPSTKGVL